jgi:hypothetical protein
MDPVKPNSETNAIEKTSKLDLERSTAIVRWMYLVSQERNTEIPSSELTQLWLVALKSYPLEAINHGFMEALREVTYPIKLSDVATRAQVWMELQEGKQVRHVEPHVKPCDCDFTKVETFCPHGYATGPDALKQVLSTAHVHAPEPKVYEIPGYEERKRILAEQLKKVQEIG